MPPDFSTCSQQDLAQLCRQQWEQLQHIKAYQDKVDELEKRCEQYRQAYDNLSFQVKELLRHRFGTRSEKYAHPGQADLFAGQSFDLPEKPAKDNNNDGIEVGAHRRKKSKKDTSHYPRIIELIELPDAEKTCDCGCQKKLLRYETKERYHYKPAEFYIVEQRREVMTCPKGCEQSLKTAPAPKQVLPKVKATESLLAHVVVSKMHHRQPLYHLEKYMDAIGVSRETMSRWLIQLVEPLQPLFNLMKDALIAYDIASIDATNLQVINEPGRRAQTKSYVYCARGGPPDQSVILYDYQCEDHKQYLESWFADFKGAIHMDAAPVFDHLLSQDGVDAAFCNAHARRYFEKVKKQAKKQGLAHEALRYYKQLYAIERQAKQQSMTPEQRYALRQEKAKPLLSDFHQWLMKNAPMTLPASPLGKAFAYCLKHWGGLTHFLTDGRIEIDNNHTEQEIKPLVIARKNFMFANSQAGARALCMHFSLVRTALYHQKDPYQYYTYILKQLPLCNTVEDYEKLLPWNVSLQK